MEKTRRSLFLGTISLLIVLGLRGASSLGMTAAAARAHTDLAYGGSLGAADWLLWCRKRVDPGVPGLPA